MTNEPIDIVLKWVDNNDPVWKQEKEKYMTGGNYLDAATAEYRFREWHNLQFIFRGIEKYMPWIRKVFIVTYGHYPAFLNDSCKRLIKSS